MSGQELPNSVAVCHDMMPTPRPLHVALLSGKSATRSPRDPVFVPCAGVANCRGAPC